TIFEQIGLEGGAESHAICIPRPIAAELRFEGKMPTTSCGRVTAGFTTLLLILTASVSGQEEPFTTREPPPLVGRWDLTVHGPEGSYPSWLEVRQSGYRTLVGSFVGRIGSVRPVSRVEYDNGRLHFFVPPQWERRVDDQHFEGRLQAAVLVGDTTDDEGRPVR